MSVSTNRPVMSNICICEDCVDATLNRMVVVGLKGLGYGLQKQQYFHLLHQLHSRYNFDGVIRWFVRAIGRLIKD